MGGIDVLDRRGFEGGRRSKGLVLGPIDAAPERGFAGGGVTPAVGRVVFDSVDAVVLVAEPAAAEGGPVDAVDLAAAGGDVLIDSLAVEHAGHQADGDADAQYAQDEEKE